MEQRRSLATRTSLPPTHWGGDRFQALRSRQTAAEPCRLIWRGKAVGAQTAQEQAARRARAVRHGALNRYVDKTQEESGAVCKDADNKVPSYMWKVTTQVSEVKRAQSHYGW